MITPELKNLILKATSLICDTVGCTLGPDGHIVTFTKDVVNKVEAFSTVDGATVASFIESEDPYESIIISQIREASLKTMRQVGDGTTTTCLMAKYLITEGLKLIENKEATPRIIAATLETLVEDVIEESKKHSIPFESEEEFMYQLIKEIATVSGKDVKIGELIAEMYEEIGINGHLEVTLNSINTSVTDDRVKGIHINAGWTHGWMITNKVNRTFEHAKLESVDDATSNPYILLVNGAITDADRIISYFNYIPENSALLVMCDHVNEAPMHKLEAFALSNRVKLCIIKYPSFSLEKTYIMSDLRLMTGATLIGPTTLPDPSHLGEVSYIVVRDHETFIGIDKYFDPQRIAIEVKKIRIELDKQAEGMNEAAWAYMQNVNKRRLGYLTGGIGIIKVGAKTLAEAKELRDRYDDAVLAVRSAIDNGFIYGGGYTSRKIYNSLINKSKDPVYKALAKVLFQGTMTLMENSEVSDDVRKEITSNPKALPYDFKERKFKKEKDFNIIEPVQVLCQSLINAVSVSKLILNTKFLVYKNIRFQ